MMALAAAARSSLSSSDLRRRERSIAVRVGEQQRHGPDLPEGLMEISPGF